MLCFIGRGYNRYIPSLARVNKDAWSTEDNVLVACVFAATVPGGLCCGIVYDCGARAFAGLVRERIPSTTRRHPVDVTPAFARPARRLRGQPRKMSFLAANAKISGRKKTSPWIIPQMFVVDKFEFCFLRSPATGFVFFFTLYTNKNMFNADRMNNIINKKKNV